MSARPRWLVLVLGTGTEVGKTWVTCRALEALRARGTSVAARKPVQSWNPDEVAAGQRLDAELLAEASGESAGDVCRPERSYPVAVAPPMAAARLGKGPLRLDDLVAELTWDEGIDVGFLEAAGGVRSPITDDGDGIDLAAALYPNVVVLVADAGLGTLHWTRGARPDPNAHHHAGTTRMAASLVDGVVDADCRVHGVGNLYVAGASVFPTAGYANPVLTIVALAARLAERLGGSAAGRLGG